MKKVLYDKINKRVADIDWFIDRDGFYWIDVDPYGLSMNGTITIKLLKKNDPQYKVINL